MLAHCMEVFSGCTCHDTSFHHDTRKQYFCSLPQYHIHRSFISDNISVNFGIDCTAAHTNTKIEHMPSSLPDFLVKSPILAP